MGREQRGIIHETSFDGLDQTAFTGTVSEELPKSLHLNNTAFPHLSVICDPTARDRVVSKFSLWLRLWLPSQGTVLLQSTEVTCKS